MNESRNVKLNFTVWSFQLHWFGECKVQPFADILLMFFTKIFTEKQVC